MLADGKCWFISPWTKIRRYDWISAVTWWPSITLWTVSRFILTRPISFSANWFPMCYKIATLALRALLRYEFSDQPRRLPACWRSLLLRLPKTEAQRCWNPSVLPARPTEISQDRREGDSRRSEWPAQFGPACSLQMPLFQYAPLGSFPWKHQSRLRVYLQASELDISSLYLTQIVLVTTTMSWPIKFFEGAKPGQKRKISSVGSASMKNYEDKRVREFKESWREGRDWLKFSEENGMTCETCVTFGIKPSVKNLTSNFITG